MEVDNKNIIVYVNRVLSGDLIERDISTESIGIYDVIINSDYGFCLYVANKTNNEECYHVRFDDVNEYKSFLEKTPEDILRSTKSVNEFHEKL